MKGVLNLYKPSGITSSDAVVKCKRILGTKAVGHMGTLDPMGEGVLLIGVGKATRLFDYYLKKDKVYEAEFAFGYETDTLDRQGEKLRETSIIPTMRDIQAVLPEFVGAQMQIPPDYSAKSIGGVRAYKLARTGKSVELAPCEIHIYSLEIIKETAKNTYMFRIHCSSGTYIRSICRDIAARLGSLATMTYIKRTRCGNFLADNAVTLAELEELGESALVSAETALLALPSVVLGDEMYAPLCNGIKIPYEYSGEDFALYCKGELFGIANADKFGIIKIKTYLRD